MPSAINLTTQPRRPHAWPTPRGFGSRLRTARRARGLTQAALEQTLDLPRATLSHWEQGLTRPQPVQVTQLAAILDIHIATLTE